MELGQAIRRRRQAQGLTLEELASRSGVSRAMLSDIERGIKNPTIKVVSQIAKALQCTVSFLLGEQPFEPRSSVELIKRHERQVLVDPQTGIARQLLIPALLRKGLEVLWYSLPAGKKTGTFPPQKHGVEGHLTVIQGHMQCTIGSEEIAVEAGDTLSFPADVSYAFYNPGPGPCHYIVIVDSYDAKVF
ncbi:XRE family transcriptional regulator [Thermosporothrix hazakensis]|jgi:transcriptional regulator with XRE-family HTH domain|uniref:XRE family transcriptional regulator n=2 Tax=Thermosporothrix TaxID=768650 RepID=A0A326U5K7_THEHA|nr:XRE family transcriptional regulator [Thermosporothrix hazakensis]PZW27531.1 XRE family transcriptional regulator [Thermosporothrix hazakensis]BBH85875.1 transcriptional regulator [Thermosporothrix sp. COM3]GCE45698.1 transcriptional regulator [Thermosporothrix hazakensis]